MMKLKELYLRYREVINYLVVGGLTTVVSLGSYYLCVLTFLDPSKMLQLQMANVISWICAVSFAYAANRKYVFESKNTNKLAEMGRFFGARVSTLVIEMVCMAFFVHLLRMNDKIAKFVVQFVVMLLNYIFSKLFVFKKENTNS